MAGVVPGAFKRLFATVRAASSRGPAKAKLFVEDMIHIGKDVYDGRNHWLTQIMQLPMQDRRRDVYAFLRGDTLQEPLWSLPVSAVATVLDSGAMWLYDRELQRVNPAATGQRSMAVLVASKQLARVQWDDAHGHIIEALFSQVKGYHNVAANARHTIDALGLKAFVDTRWGGQRMVLASVRGPGLAGVDVIGEIMQNYGWELLTNGA